MRPRVDDDDLIANQDVVEAPPYPGAKNSFLIEDKLEDWKWLSELVKITVKALPSPKVKKPKKK